MRLIDCLERADLEWCAIGGAALIIGPINPWLPRFWILLSPQNQSNLQRSHSKMPDLNQNALHDQLISMRYEGCLQRKMAMIKKIARIKNLNDKNLDDLKFWLSKPPEERVATVDYLRRQFHGGSKRLQRVARVIQRPQS